MVFNIFLQLCLLKLMRQLLSVEVIKVIVISNHPVLWLSPRGTGEEWRVLGCHRVLQLARLKWGARNPDVLQRLCLWYSTSYMLAATFLWSWVELWELSIFIPERNVVTDLFMELEKERTLELVPPCLGSLSFKAGCLLSWTCEQFRYTQPTKARTEWVSL